MMRIYVEFIGVGVFYFIIIVFFVFKLVWFLLEFEKCFRFYIYIYLLYLYEVMDVYICYILDGLIVFNLFL